ncbi:hypothetical protein [Halosimplex sp. J119]
MVLGVVLYAGLVIGSGFGVLWGIGSLLIGFDRYREGTAIRDTPISPLDSIAVGPVAVRGEIEPVGSPETRMYDCPECVAYDLSVRDFGSGDSRTHVDRTRVIPFDIATDDGSIRVDDDAFDFLASDEREWKRERESYESPDEDLWHFERSWDIDELRTGDERVYEATYLCPGDEVYAYGTAEIDERRIDDADKPLRLTDRDGTFFVSDREPDALRRERRFALAKEVAVGVVAATVSLTAFLWLTGIAQLFLGA